MVAWVRLHGFLWVQNTPRQDQSQDRDSEQGAQRRSLSATNFSASTPPSSYVRGSSYLAPAPARPGQSGSAHLLQPGHSGSLPVANPQMMVLPSSNHPTLPSGAGFWSNKYFTLDGNISVSLRISMRTHTHIYIYIYDHICSWTPPMVSPPPPKPRGGGLPFVLPSSFPPSFLLSLLPFSFPSLFPFFLASFLRSYVSSTSPSITIAIK